MRLVRRFKYRVYLVQSTIIQRRWGSGTGGHTGTRAHVRRFETVIRLGFTERVATVVGGVLIGHTRHRSDQ